MTTKTALGLAATAVLLNGILGHFLAPTGILLTPVVLTVTTSLVCFGTQNVKSVFLALWTYVFVALNDFSIKLYSGGVHDKEGSDIVNIVLIMGLVPALGILATTVLRRKQEPLKTRIRALLLFAGLGTVHLILFFRLGLGRYYWYDWNN